MDARAPSRAAVILLFFLYSAVPPPFSYTPYKIALELTHSLLTRVADKRASRGDLSGAARARKLAGGIDRWTQREFSENALSAVRLKFLKYFYWIREIDYSVLNGVVSDANELARMGTDLTRGETNAGSGSYENALPVLKRMFGRLLKALPKSGELREVTEILQDEIVKGTLLNDCIEVGSNDLTNLLQTLKQLVQITGKTKPKSKL